MNRTIAIINESSVMTDAQLAPIIAALQIQVTRDFAPVWGTDATLRIASATDKDPSSVIGPPSASEWQLVILDTSDDAGALGYHDTTPEGLPLGKVFAKSDLDDNSSLSATISHELLEMLADPDISTLKECQANGKSTIFALEVCDPCEDDKFGYWIDVPNDPIPAFFASPEAVAENVTYLAKFGLRLSDDHATTSVLVSDFIYPRWFHNYRIDNAPTMKSGDVPNSAIEMPAAVKFDHTGNCKQPFEILEGGYMGVLDPQRGWTDVQRHRSTIDGLGELIMAGGAPKTTPLRYNALPRLGSRRERRRRPRHLWQRSVKK